MIESKDITVVVPCLFADTKPIWMLMESAGKFGFANQVRPYGIGAVYDGWMDIKLKKLLAECHRCETSHILYTDARDAWFIGGLQEIADKYNALGCPDLMLSAQCDVFCTYARWYEGIPWDMAKEFRYVGTPGQLCRTSKLAEALTWMKDNYHLGEDDHGLPDDDPPWWIEFMRAHPGELKFDHGCSIFMNAGSCMSGERDMWTHCLEIRGNRVFNKLTGEYPCILHFNGGSSAALEGKWDRLEKFWRALGNTSRAPWER